MGIQSAVTYNKWLIRSENSLLFVLEYAGPLDTNIYWGITIVIHLIDSVFFELCLLHFYLNKF